MTEKISILEIQSYYNNAKDLLASAKDFLLKSQKATLSGIEYVIENGKRDIFVLQSFDISTALRTTINENDITVIFITNT